MDSGDTFESCCSDIATTKSSSVVQDVENSTEISTLEFLNFLKIAYQVQDSLEKIILSSGGGNETIDWLKMKETKLVKQPSSTNIDSTEDIKKKGSHSSTSNADNSDTDSILKKKLDEVMSEGLLDSVLPYMVPNHTNAMTKKTSKLNDKTNQQANNTSNSSLSKRRNSDITCTEQKVVTKTDSEVEIHVCDEVKNERKDFVCNKDLLLQKMCYFADVTAGQRLEEMDISVHCDIGIFEWLMKWVKKEQLLQEDWPQLTPQCVIPILVSAAFLQMEQLQTDCLLYCHENMNEILRTQPNLSCLNDAIITRLAAMYTNHEVEAIKDRKDRIQSKIFMKLIMSLAELEPESVRGHWCSLARVFRCQKCQQLVSPSVATKIPCIPSCMQLQCDGSIINLHVRDPSWNINDYIMKLHKTFKSWRRVYWRLWGDAHFLYCVTCKRYFSAREIRWCRFHPDPPQYFTLDTQKAPLPVGRFPCCGERAFRFQLLPDYTGCQFKEHTVNMQDVKDCAIMQMLTTYKSLIEEDPPQLLFPERLTRLIARDPSSGDKKLVCKENFWWEGFQIIPPRPKLGLLSAFSNRISSGTPNNTSNTNSTSGQHYNAESTDDETSENSSGSTKSDSLSSIQEQGVESEIVPPPARKKHIVRKRNRKLTGLWQTNCSARSNQDNQRTYEENVMKDMMAVLNRRTSVNIGHENVKVSCRGACRNYAPLGGIWVKLESDWKEANYHQYSQMQKKEQRQKKNMK